jgi:hypothetical protein
VRQDSISVNLDQAACQPPAVSGHHSIGWNRAAPAGQIP